MKPDRSAFASLAALCRSARAAGRLGRLAQPWIALALGVLLFLLACWGLSAARASGAALLFIPAIFWEVVAFGAEAGLAATGLATLAAWQLLAADGGAPLYCTLAAAVIALVNALAGALDRRTSALAEARRATAMREAVFAEAQHRIGNNLTIICAALNLQARTSRDAATKRALQDASARVTLIAEVNRMLTESREEAVRFDATFVESLVSKSIAAVGAEERVRFSVAIEPIDLRPDFVLPIMLVLGECVNNALEHGFPGEASGSLEVRLETLADDPGRSRLTVADDGAGLPAGFDPDHVATTGLTLIHAFARQVGGLFRLESNHGTRSTFTF